MLFIVRGKNASQERSMRVQAETAEEAERIGWTSGLFVTEVTAVTSSNNGSTAVDRIADLVSRAWKGSTSFKAFGRAITHGQAAALLLRGIATLSIDVHKLILH